MQLLALLAINFKIHLITNKTMPKFNKGDNKMEKLVSRDFFRFPLADVLLCMDPEQNGNVCVGVGCRTGGGARGGGRRKM